MENDKNICTFNQNGSCIFYDVISADIDKCMKLLDPLPFDDNIVEAHNILYELRKRI